MIFTDVLSGLSGEKETVLASAPALVLVLVILKPRPFMGSHVLRFREFEDIASRIERDEERGAGLRNAASASEALPEGSQGLLPSRHYLLVKLQLLSRQGMLPRSPR